jgi:hypothetical protein
MKSGVIEWGRNNITGNNEKDDAQKKHEAN